MTLQSVHDFASPKWDKEPHNDFPSIWRILFILGCRYSPPRKVVLWIITFDLDPYLQSHLLVTLPKMLSNWRYCTQVIIMGQWWASTSRSLWSILTLTCKVVIFCWFHVVFITQQISPIKCTERCGCLKVALNVCRISIEDFSFKVNNQIELSLDLTDDKSTLVQVSFSAV